MADITKIDTFIQSSPPPAWLATTQGHCVHANPARERRTGLNSDQINQADWRSFLLEEDRAVGSAFWQMSLATGTPYRVRSACEGAMASPNASTLSPSATKQATTSKIAKAPRKPWRDYRAIWRKAKPSLKKPSASPCRVLGMGHLNGSSELVRLIASMDCGLRYVLLIYGAGKVHSEDWQGGMEEALGGARFNAECRLFRPTGEVRIGALSE